jgi:hypothetical protein
MVLVVLAPEVQLKLMLLNILFYLLGVVAVLEAAVVAAVVLTIPE